MILIFILYFCLACGFAFGKAALTYMPPLLFVGIRMTLAGLLLVGYHIFFKKKSLYIQPQHRTLFACICLFHIYGSYVLEYWALQYISSFKASLLYNLSPFVTALLAYVLSGETITLRKWVGLLIGVMGVIPLLIESEQQESIGGMIGYVVSYAELALLASVICAAIGWIVMRRMIQIHNYSPFMLNGISMVVGGLLSLMSSFISEGWPHLLTNSNTEPFFHSAVITVFFYIFLLIFLCNIISYNLYGILLRSYSTTFLSFAGFITPLCTALLSSLFFGERPSISFFISVVGVGSGLYLFYREELRMQTTE